MTSATFEQTQLYSAQYVSDRKIARNNNEKMVKIHGHENYTINKNGEIFSIRGRRQIYGLLDTYGYRKVSLTNFKTRAKYELYVHDIMARTFVKNPQNDTHITHIDGNTDNNTASNLLWVPFEEGIFNMPGDKYQVRFIDRRNRKLITTGNYEKLENAYYYFHKRIIMPKLYAAIEARNLIELDKNNVHTISHENHVIAEITPNYITFDLIPALWDHMN